MGNCIAGGRDHWSAANAMERKGEKKEKGGRGLPMGGIGFQQCRRIIGWKPCQGEGVVFFAREETLERINKRVESTS